MAGIRFEQNMGQMDRIMRSAIGGALLANGMNSDTFISKIGGLIGGAFVFYGLTGYDPLLQVANTSTKASDENSLQSKARSRGQEAYQRGQETLQRGQEKVKEQMDNVFSTSGQSV